MVKRHIILPDRGTLLVNTDIHGHLGDFRRLRTLFEQAQRDDPAGAHWVILGDVVHGPDEIARTRNPELYGYPDESMEIVRRIVALQQAYPGRVHFVLGNHDHGHVGGPHTTKFHRDEVDWLESGTSRADVALLKGLFQSALLAAAAPCGLLLTHGSPNEALERLEDLDEISLSGEGNDARRQELLHSLLTHYGQKDSTAKTVLENVSRGGLDLKVIVHGHDRDENGFFVDGERQLCLCIFGAPREKKRYLCVNLAGRYRHVTDLRDGVEIRRLYA